MDFKEEYSNASEIKKENIPPSVLDDLAVLLYGVLCRTEEEQNLKTVSNG